MLGTPLSKEINVCSIEKLRGGNAEQSHEALHLLDAGRRIFASRGERLLAQRIDPDPLLDQGAHEFCQRGTEFGVFELAQLDHTQVTALRARSPVRRWER